jgi:glycosyltransferase involved in cell wall biosynthesis
VVLACPGLDHVARGYETFARELAQTLDGEPSIELVLYKGTGSPATGEVVGSCLRRDASTAQLAARIVHRSAASYELEASSFVPSVLRFLRRQPTDVLWTSDKLVAMGVARVRNVTRGSLRVLFTNGGPYPGPFPYADLVHQLSQDALDSATTHGEPSDRSALVPLGFHFPPLRAPLRGEAMAARRRALALPADRKIVIAVGALDFGHKRHDHLIREIARIDDRPFLLMLGQETPETGALRDLARATLGTDGFAARTVAPGEVSDYLAAVDVFALASIVEAFGRVYVEAAAAGLPCIVHDFPVAHEVLGQWGRYVDMAKPGALTHELRVTLRAPELIGGTESARWVRDRYSWDVLRSDYLALIERAALSARRRWRSGTARR